MTIKETAGKVLLYFYQLQRTVPLEMQYRQLGFIEKKNVGVSLTSDKKWLTNDLLDINPSSVDIFNAFMYLLDKGYVKSSERGGSGAKVFMGVNLGTSGIDIVEGVERGEDGINSFKKAFNISPAGDATVDSLIKDTLSALMN